MAVTASSSGSSSGPELDERLAGWMAQGLIDAGQAERIGAAEAARHAVPAATPRRLPLVAEALGYLGAVLAVMAGLIAARQLLPAISVGAELAFAAAGAGVLLLVGIMLPVKDRVAQDGVALDRVALDRVALDRVALGRLRSVLWLASVASLAAFAGLVTGPHFGNLGPAARPLVAEAVVTVYAIALWWRSRGTLQHLAVFAGTAVLAGTGITQIWDGYPPWQLGVGLWLLSLLWGIAAHRGYLAPRTVGYAAAGVGLLVSTQLNMDLAAGQALAVVTVAGLLAAGVALRRVLLLALGAVGAIVILPQVADRYLPNGVGAAAAMFAAGMAILGAALWLARRRAGA
jgi:hypothetical protein